MLSQHSNAATYHTWHFGYVLTGVALSLIATTALADFGSKHTDQHRSDSRQESRQRAPVQDQKLFDFSGMEDRVSKLHSGAVEAALGGHIDQSELEALADFEAYVVAFEEGDELFEINYNALDGAGVNVGNGQRFTSLPRPDLTGPEAWASVLPHRITGPNSDSCISCHNVPVADGAGGVNDNAIRIDPERKQKGFIERQAPHIFGFGAVQLLAEEMTTELQASREQAATKACATGQGQLVSVSSKNVEFGRMLVKCDSVDYRQLKGIDQDLVVKPFEWKGLTAFARDFVRGAAHQELGMQATEMVGDADSDFDNVSNELSVGDITALTIYNAAQPRPVTRLELNQITAALSEDELEQYDLPLGTREIDSINSGEQVFANMQCTSCHTASLTVASPIYSEPSRHPEFRDEVFPAGEQVNLPNKAITFDITNDILDNQAMLPAGQTLGQFERDAKGGATVRLYGDLKRHNMGRRLAEEFDEGNVGNTVFLTENLWGIGSTAPYLHDGRATTLTEAILFHGGEAKESKQRFKAASTAEQTDLMAFLDNLVLYLEP
jgi:hypothetical protein